MSDISVSGDGMEFLIVCKPIPIHHWMSFACCHSIRRNLPDAKIMLVCDMQRFSRDLFGWTYRCGVKIIRKNLESDRFLESYVEEEKGLLISPYIMAVREYNGLLGPVPAKSEIPATLVDCESGCGKFVVSEWVDRLVPPFLNAPKVLGNDDATVNEMKVLTLWDNGSWLYATTSR